MLGATHSPDACLCECGATDNAEYDAMPLGYQALPDTIQLLLLWGRQRSERQHGETGDGDVHGNDVLDGLSQVVVDAASETDRRHNGAEVVVKQDDR